MERKGIILAGGHGTRLKPLTDVVCKQLLPVYNKPMILYPINTLLTAGITDISIIIKSSDWNYFNKLLTSINPTEERFKYRFVIQDTPNGLAEAFTLTELHTKDNPVALILGDNLFYGGQFDCSIRHITPNENVIFGYKVKNPSAYGVAVLGDDGKLIDVVEKPSEPPSNYAISGLYFFDSSVVEKARNCVPSKRGELEIVDVIKQYISKGNIRLNIMDNHTAWFDCGTHDDLLDAANFVRAIETRTNSTVCSL